MPAMSKEHRQFWKEKDYGDDHGVVIEPIVALVVAIALIVMVFFIVISIENTSRAEAAPATVAHVERGETGDPVTAVQAKLRSFGYSVVVDGQFGPQTQRAVRHFQRVNRLAVDGVVGPITSRALGVSQAVRVTPPTAQPAPTPPPVTQSTASGPCAEFVPLLQQYSPGWDVSHFQNIMYRESRCDPSARNASGASGLLQIMPLHVPNLGPCGVTSAGDLLNAEKNICSAAIIYRRAGGTSPWSQTR